MENVRYGIIGISNMGYDHVKMLCAGKVRRAELTAVCDTKTERLDLVHQEYGPKIACFTDYHEMFQSGLIDAVVIATPHYFHPIIAKEAFEAGIHVLCEKPAGVFTQNVREMNEAAAKSGLKFGIMFNKRTSPMYQKAREMIQNGELGELKRLVWIITNVYRTQIYYDSGGWRATWKGEGGGVLLNQCPHFLDLWQWIFGMPTRIQAMCYEGKYHHIEVEDDVTINAEYANGATATFITSTGEAPGTNRLEISGDRGKIVIEDEKMRFWKLAVPERTHCFTCPGGFTRPEWVEMEVACPGEYTQHVGIFQNYTDSLLDGVELLTPGEEGINSLLISNAAYLSAWSGGKWIDLPPDEELFCTLLQQKIDNSTYQKNLRETVFSTENTHI